MKKLGGLSEPVLALTGQPLTEPDGKAVTVASILANALARGSSEEPVRAMDLALRIYNADGSLDVEDADFKMLVETVRKDGWMNNMAKAAALNVLGE